MCEHPETKLCTKHGLKPLEVAADLPSMRITEKDTSDIEFQQKAATCDTANVPIDLMRIVFENPLISRNGAISEIVNNLLGWTFAVGESLRKHENQSKNYNNKGIRMGYSWTSCSSAMNEVVFYD